MVHSDSVNLKSRSNIAIAPLGKQSEDEIRLKSYKSLWSELVDVVQVIAWCHAFTTQCSVGETDTLESIPVSHDEICPL